MDLWYDVRHNAHLEPLGNWCSLSRASVQQTGHRGPLARFDTSLQDSSVSIDDHHGTFKYRENFYFDSFQLPASILARAFKKCRKSFLLCPIFSRKSSKNLLDDTK